IAQLWIRNACAARDCRARSARCWPAPESSQYRPSRALAIRGLAVPASDDPLWVGGLSDGSPVEGCPAGGSTVDGSETRCALWTKRASRATAASASVTQL